MSVEQQRNRVPIGPFVREIQKLYPQGTRTPARMRQLYDATVDAWHMTADAIREVGPPPDFVGARDQLQLDIRKFIERMQGYAPLLETAETEEQLRPVINGFLINYPGSGHITPDFATPMTIWNQFDAGRSSYDIGASFKAVGEVTEEATGAVVDWTAREFEEAEETLRSIGWNVAAGLWAIPVAIAAGVFGYLVIMKDK